MLAAALFGLDRAFPPELGRLDAVGQQIVDRAGRTLALRPAPGGVWRLATGADDVSPAALDALVRSEDRRFWWHPGVDPVALGRALFQDLRAGRVVSGGSTLTMQAVRLLHPRRRTLVAKLIEAARAMQLEAHLSKRDILRVWLTLAPFGGNLEGMRAASWAYFGVEPRALDPVQAAFLVVLPRRPEALRPDRHPGRALVPRDRVLAAAGWTGPVAGGPHGRLAMPDHGGPVLDGLTGPRVATTLDLPLQDAVRRLAAEPGLPAGSAAAILVADIAMRSVLALSGGPGGLDLTRAVRSPGSALKPFIYGMAFQDGIAGPQTPVDDVPRRFGGYAPEDFDHAFAGRVTAGEALRRSLNLPAVALLDRVGPLRFVARLADAGVALRLPPGTDPSLPVALGGVGIRLRDLAALYAALASDGRVAALRLAGAPGAGRPLLSPEAASLVAGVLTQRLPDGGPAGVAWKTGTSWGGRDAWAAGFDARHVVVVWIGRPDGTPLPDATGRSLALPLFARVYGLLPPDPLPEPSVLPGPRAPPLADLRLLFPPPGAELSGDGPVVLRAMGGRRPLSFLVDGARLAADPARRQAAWVPDGPGFYRLTVVDADGQAQRAAVRVR